MYYGKESGGIEYPEGQRFVYLNQPMMNIAYPSNTYDTMHPYLYPQTALFPSQNSQLPLNPHSTAARQQQPQPPTGTVFYPPAAQYSYHNALTSYNHHHQQAQDMFPLNQAFAHLSMIDSAALVYTGQPVHSLDQPQHKRMPSSLPKTVFLGKSSPPSSATVNGHPGYQQRKSLAELELSSALFFVIKSYSEEDVQRSIRHGIWCSTEHGNRRLDNAYRSLSRTAPLILFFSVNGSGKFCGVAEMISTVDYAKCSGIWAQTKWRGEFKVRWLIVKDVPNSSLRHIRNETNEDRPVTNSRDATSLPTDKGSHLLTLIRNYRMTGGPLTYEAGLGEGHREVKNGGSQISAPTPVKILKPPNRPEN